MPLQMTKLEWLLSVLRKGKPVLVQVGDKHDPYTYLATTEDELADACLAVISDRRDYYHSPEEPTPPSLSNDQIAALPDGPVKVAALNDVMRASGERVRHNREAREWALLERGRAGDWKAAFAFLHARDGSEYEAFEVVEARKARKLNRKSPSP